MIAALLALALRCVVAFEAEPHPRVLWWRPLTTPNQAIVGSLLNAKDVQIFNRAIHEHSRSARFKGGDHFLSWRPVHQPIGSDDSARRNGAGKTLGIIYLTP